MTNEAGNEVGLKIKRGSFEKLGVTLDIDVMFELYIWCKSFWNLINNFVTVIMFQ